MAFLNQSSETKVKIAGVIVDLLGFDFAPTGRMSLERVDGSEQHRGSDCVNELLDDHEPEAEEVETVITTPEDSSRPVSIQ